MTYDPNDPRLTAYALGELDESDRAAVEALLAESEDSRRAVEEIRATAQLLTEQLHREVSPGLTEAHHAAIETKLKPPRPAIRFGWIPFAIAACLMCAGVGLMLPWLELSRRSNESSVIAFNSTESVAASKAPQASRLLQSTIPSRTPPPPPAAAAPEKSLAFGGGYAGRFPATSAPAGPPGDEGTRYAVQPEGLVRERAGPTLSLRTEPAEPAQATEGRESQLARRSFGLQEAGRDQKAQDANRPVNQLGAQLEQKQAAPADGMPRAVGLLGAGDAPASTPPETPALKSVNQKGAGGQEGAKAPAQQAQAAGVAAQPEAAKNRQGQPAPEAAPAADQAALGEALVRENNEAYKRIVDNPFLRVTDAPLSTFSIDVDTASYANVRRFLNQGQRPPQDAVRIEELVNYFSYNYPQPTGDDPFSINVEIARCPWTPDHRLARIGLKGREIANDQRPPSNLCFLIDVSGSMQDQNKLPLLKSALRMLVEQLGENDRVAIAVYAQAEGLVLPSTSCAHKGEVRSALDLLQAGGSTNGGAGIQLAYDTAVANFIKGGTNRVILCTDGDFNVGITNDGDLTRLIESKAKSGVFLSVLGFGMGNLKDSKMEALADKGNGNYAYIDTMLEARKVLVEQLSGTLVTIAKDVKIQVEFNPAQVAYYRLIGYENRLLRDQDFNDDTKDAGEIGAGHTVTALYELVPAGKEVAIATVDPLKYRAPSAPAGAAAGAAVRSDASRESLTVKLRYKQPDGDTSRKIERGVIDEGHDEHQASADFKFAAAVAEFGMQLRDSPYRGKLSLAGVLELASGSMGEDPSGYRHEFVELVRKAQQILGNGR